MQLHNSVWVKYIITYRNLGCSMHPPLDFYIRHDHSTYDATYSVAIRDSSLFCFFLPFFILILTTWPVHSNPLRAPELGQPPSPNPNGLRVPDPRRIFVNI